MFGLRSDLRFNTQKAYGNYCSYTRSKNKEPFPYYVFSDYFSKGFRVKEIFKKLH